MNQWLVLLQADLIRSESIFPSQFDPKHLVLETFEELKNIAQEFELSNGEVIPGFVVFAKKDKAFILFLRGEYLEVENIFYDTDADNIVAGLYLYKNYNNQYAFFKEAYKLIEQSTGKKMFPFVVMNTSNNDIEFIEEQVIIWVQQWLL